MIPTNLSRSHTSKSGYPMDCDPASNHDTIDSSYNFAYRKSNSRLVDDYNQYSNYPLSAGGGIGIGGAHSNNSSSNSSRTSSNYHAQDTIH